MRAHKTVDERRIGWNRLTIIGGAKLAKIGGVKPWREWRETVAHRLDFELGRINESAVVRIQRLKHSSVSRAPCNMKVFSTTIKKQKNKKSKNNNITKKKSDKGIWPIHRWNKKHFEWGRAAMVLRENIY